MGETEGRQETNEAGRPGGGAPGGLPRSVEGDGLAVPSIEPAPVIAAAPEGEKDFIKRVVGLPGDRVEVRNKRVWINGELLVETYPQFVDPAMVPAHARCAKAATAMSPHHNECRDNIGPWTVPENSYLVMG